jgi:hypothetical protein
MKRKVAGPVTFKEFKKKLRENTVGSPLMSGIIHGVNQVAFGLPAKIHKVYDLLADTEEANPKASRTGSTIGEIVSFGIPGGVLGKLSKARKLASAAKLTKGVKGAVTTGAVSEGIRDAAKEWVDDKDASDVAGHALSGAVKGAGTGLVGAGVTKLISAAAKAGANITGKRAASAVERHLHRNIPTEDVSKIAARAKESMARGGPHIDAVTGGEGETLALADRLRLKDPNFAEILRDRAAKHDAGQSEILKAQVKKLSGGRTREQFVEEIKNKGQKAASKHYEKFYKDPSVGGKTFVEKLELHKEPLFEKAHKDSKAILNKDLTKEDYSNRLLDETKKKLGGVIENFKKNNPQQSYIPTQIKEKLTDALKKESPSYAKALEKSSKYLGTESAGEAGKKALGHAKDISGDFKQLKNALERKAYKLGVLEDIENAIDKKAGSTISGDLTQSIRTAGHQGKIKALFGEKGKDLLDTSEDLAKAKNRLHHLSGGSKTAEHVSNAENSYAPSVVKFLKNPARASWGFAAKGAAKLGGIHESPEIRAQMQKYLEDPHKLKNAIRRAKMDKKLYGSDRRLMRNMGLGYARLQQED